jgi:hypothetical protein
MRDMMLAQALDAVATFLRHDIELAMSRHNGPVGEGSDAGG